MAASPHVLVQNGAGPFINPDNTGDLNFPSGANVTPGNVVSIKLASADSVSTWTLRVVGTDEETVVPTLAGVDHSTGVVSTPSTVVTFTVPSGVAGRAYIFQSMVNNGGPAYTTTFGIYTLTSDFFRVGAVGERFENDPIFGWTRTLNQFIKRGGGGGGIPPIAHIHFATIIEDPLGTLTWERFTDDMLVGGYRAVADHAARDAIPVASRKVGMWVQTLNDGDTWNLASNLTTWTLVGGGGGAPTGPAGGDLGGTYPKPEVIGILGNQVVSAGGTIDFNLPLGADLLPGSVFGPLPGSGDPQRVINFGQYDFAVVRKSTIVVVNVNHVDPTDFVSTVITLTNAGATLDLNLVTILNGVYDGSRYLWFVGDFNGTGFYLWRVDSTLVNPVVVYQLNLTLPSVINQLRSVVYTDGMVLVVIRDGHDSKYKILKINPTNGSIISVVPFPALSLVTGPTVVGTIAAGSNPRFAAWDGSGHIYISNNFSNDITRISVATGLADLTIPLASSPFGLAWGGGSLMYVAGGAGEIYKIDIATGSLVGPPITVGPTPFSIAWDGATHLYVSNNGDVTVSIIDINTESVSTISVGFTPYGVAWDGGLYVWVAGFSSNSIVRIAVSSGTVFDTIPMTGAPFGGFPMFMAWDHLSHMYATDINGYVYQMSVATGAIDNTVGLGFQANTGITWDGGTHMWVAVFQNDTVVTIDTTLAILDHTVNVPTGSSPYGIAWDGGTHVYTANQGTNNSTRLLFGGSIVTALVPDLDAATSNQDYSWYGGFIGSTTRSKVSRFNPSTLAHKINDIPNIETHPIATDLATVQVLLNSLKAKYTAHLTQAGVHLVNDTDTLSLVSVPDATDSLIPVTFPLCAALVNDLKAKFNAHRTQSGVHANDDTVNIVTTPDSTASSLSSIITLANDLGYAVGITLHGKYNAHLSQKVGGLPVHRVDDWVNTEISPIATDLVTLKDLLQDLAFFYTQHITNPVFHTNGDVVNVLTASTNLDADVGQYQTSTILANRLKSALNYHLLKTESHYHYDQDLITTPNADASSYTDLAGVIALANAIGYGTTNGVFNTHLSEVRSIVHELMVYDEFVSYTDLTAGTTSVILSNAESVVNAFRTMYNQHLVYPGVHLAEDLINASTAADATDSPGTWWPTASALANDIKAQFNAHALNNGGAYHNTNDTGNLVGAPDSTPDDLLSIINLTNALGYAIGYGSYNRHRIAVGSGLITVGAQPQGVAWDGGGFMYVVNQNDGNVSVINKSTHAIVTTVAVDPAPTSVAWDGGLYMYVTCAGDFFNPGTVVRITISTQTVFDSIPVGVLPIAVAQCGTNMYVCNGAGSISVIDISTGIPGTPISLPGAFPDAIVGVTTNFIYVADGNNNLVIKINVNTLVQHTLGVGLDPDTISWDGNSTLYVGNYGDGVTAGTVTEIALDSFTVNQTVTLGVGVSGICWDGGAPGFMYATNWVGSTVSRIDASTGLVSSTVNMGSGLGPLGIAWDGGPDIWVTETANNPGSVARILVATGELVLGSFIHQANDQDNTEALPYDGTGVVSDSTLADVENRLNDLATQYTNHISDLGAGAPYHFATDVTNVLTAPTATDVAPTFPTLFALATELKTKFNAHLVQAGVHFNNDITSTITNTQNENIRAFPAPDPVDDADFTGIINIIRALATFQYYGYPTAFADNFNGAYNFHLSQSSEFLDTADLILTSGSIVELNNYLNANGYYYVIAMSSDSTGIPFFDSILSQSTNGTNPSLQPPGVDAQNWNFTSLSIRYPRRFTIVSANHLWFTAGGIPDETTLPYSVNRTPSILSPFFPYTDINVTIPPGLIPTDISNDFSSPIRISYGLGDYVGDLNDGTGGRDELAKYPMGGALGFSPLVVKFGALVVGTPIGTFDNINITGTNSLYTPTVTGSTLNIQIPPAGTWNPGGGDVLPSDILKGFGVQFENFGSGTPLTIHSKIPNVKAVALKNITQSNAPDFAAVNFDGITINNGDRVLLWRQDGSSIENGLYFLSGTNFLIHTFSVYDDSPCGSKVYVEQGETFAGRTFEQTTLGDPFSPTWVPELGPDLAPPLTTYNGSGGSITWHTIDTVPSPPADGYDVVLVVDNVATRSTGTIQRERGVTTYRQASGTLTLSDDSRSLTSTNFFRQVISGTTVQIQVGQQASAGGNWTFRVRAWFEYVRAV